VNLGLAVSTAVLESKMVSTEQFQVSSWGLLWKQKWAHEPKPKKNSEATTQHQAAEWDEAASRRVQANDGDQRDYGKHPENIWEQPLGQAQGTGNACLVVGLWV
jgi:hypothetical protein